jgi:hypothetical protein
MEKGLLQQHNHFHQNATQKQNVLLTIQERTYLFITVIVRNEYHAVSN